MGQSSGHDKGPSADPRHARSFAVAQSVVAHWAEPRLVGLARHGDAAMMNVAVMDILTRINE
jgi:hypothetical protein